MSLFKESLIELPAREESKLVSIIYDQKEENLNDFTQIIGHAEVL